MKNCNNSELLSWVVATMAAVIGAGVAMYYISGIPCGGGLFIAIALISAALTMALAGMKPAFERYKTCWKDDGKRCTVSFSTIEGMINSAVGVIAATIAPLLVGALAALTECITIPLVGIIISVATSLPIGAITAAMLIGSVVLFGTLIWAISTIQTCLSKIYSDN